MALSQITQNGKIITLDTQQKQLHQYLQNLTQYLIQKDKKNGFFFRFFRSNKSNSQKMCRRSIYIYGEVGRGKSLLMMDFFHNLPFKNKIHWHFNSFMQRLHAELHRLRNDYNRNNDLVETATDNIIGNNIVICFDEMQVEDVADALLLRRIFSRIFARKIIVIFTSNCHPEELYLHGLQRDVFLEFIRLVLYKNCEIFNLNGLIDYRSDYLKSIGRHYFSPVNDRNLKIISEIFNNAIDHNNPRQVTIEVTGRKLIIEKSYHNIAWFDFAELCSANLGVADYQAICQQFKIIFLVNVPKLTKEERNEAKRLILFIDEVYENKVMLLVLAAVPVNEIYEHGIGSKTFKRTVSRLNEITARSFEIENI